MISDSSRSSHAHPEIQLEHYSEGQADKVELGGKSVLGESPPSSSGVCRIGILERDDSYQARTSNSLARKEGLASNSEAPSGRS